MSTFFSALRGRFPAAMDARAYINGITFLIALCALIAVAPSGHASAGDTLPVSALSQAVLSVEAPADPPIPSGGVSIAVWDFPRIPHPGNPNDKFRWLSEICSRFEAANPGVRVVLTKLTWSQGGEKIKIATFAGVPPDITSSDIPIRYIDDGLVEPAGAYITTADRADYFQSAVGSFSYKGEIYGFPWAQKTDFLYLNRKVFASAGVEPPKDGMWSYDEFVSSMRRISAATKKPSFGFSIAAEQTSELPFLFAFGGNILDPAKMWPGVKLLHDAAHVWRISSSESGGIKPTSLFPEFREKQELAVAPFGMWALPALIKDAKIDFDIAQYPYDPAAKSPGGLSGSSVIGYFVFRQKDPVKRHYCMKLASFITNSENQRILRHYGQFPTRRSVSSIYDDVPVMKKAFSLFEHSRPNINHPAMPAIDETLKNAVQKMLLSNSLSTAEAEAACRDTAAKIAGVIDSATRKREAEKARRESGVSYAGHAAVIFSFAAVVALFAWRRSIPRFARDLSVSRAAYIFILPAVALFVVFFIMPIFRGVLISFQDFSFGSGVFENFSGISNYRSAVADRVFLASAVNTLIYTVVIVPSTIFIALMLAVFLYRLSERVQTAFKGAFYLPGVVSIVTLCIVWRYIFNAQSGFLNMLLVAMGFAPVKWLTSQEMSLVSIMIFTILKGPGGALLIYLTALCNIPKDYFEAAAVDGAGPVRTFFKITVPLLAPQTMFLAITLTIDAMQVFAPVMLLTEGGPANSSEVVIHRIYKEAFNNLNIGEASAMSMLLFAVILVASLIQYKYFSYDYY